MAETKRRTKTTEKTKTRTSAEASSTSSLTGQTCFADNICIGHMPADRIQSSLLALSPGISNLVVVVVVVIRRARVLYYRVYFLSNFLLKTISSKPKVSAPPTILIMKSIIPTLKSPAGRIEESAKLLSKDFSH